MHVYAGVHVDWLGSCRGEPGQIRRTGTEQLIHMQRSTRQRLGSILLVVVVGWMCRTSGSAASITYDYDHLFSGDAPVGSSPWLRAVLTDSGANTVRMTLTALGLTGNEFATQLYLNLNPALDPQSLVFAESGPNASALISIQTGTDAFKVAGDGKYDIRLNFSGFGTGNSMSFTISGIAGLTANDFLFTDTPSAGHSAFYSVVGVQTTTASVLLDTPEVSPSVPDGSSTAVLLGLAALIVGGAKTALRVCRPIRQSG